MCVCHDEVFIEGEGVVLFPKGSISAGLKRVRQRRRERQVVDIARRDRTFDFDAFVMSRYVTDWERDDG